MNKRKSKPSTTDTDTSNKPKDDTLNQTVTADLNSKENTSIQTDTDTASNRKDTVSNTLNAQATPKDTIKTVVIQKKHPIESLETKEDAEEALRGLITTSESKESLEKSIKSLLDGVFINAKPTASLRVAKCLTIALNGETWGKALDDGEISWAALDAYKSHYPAFNRMMSCVERVAMEANKARRIKKADSRAFDGWDRPIFQGGKLVGSERQYSDRLAELLLKGDDPARFNPQSVGSQAGSQGNSGPIAIQINVNMPNPANSNTITIDNLTSEKPQ